MTTELNYEPRSVSTRIPARPALILLLSINLFNYIDRYVLAQLISPIRRCCRTTPTHFKKWDGLSLPS